MILKIHCLIYPAETDNQLLFTLQLQHKLYKMSKETYANDTYLQKRKGSIKITLIVSKQKNSKIVILFFKKVH